MARSSHIVRGKAMHVLAYPARLELVDMLSLHQPATVEELARHLGREPKSLYRHLRPLVAAGLVEQAGQRSSGRRPATLYRLPADVLELDPDDHGPRAREARRRIGRAILRTTGRLHEAALADRDTRFGGRDCDLALAHRTARLTAAGRRRVDAKLRELFELLGAEHDPRGVPYTVTLGLAPARHRHDGP